MSGPKPEETHGVPWGDHNATQSSPPDPRRDEYGEEEGADADQRVKGDDETHETDSSHDA